MIGFCTTIQRSVALLVGDVQRGAGLVSGLGLELGGLRLEARVSYFRVSQICPAWRAGLDGRAIAYRDSV